MTEPTQHEPTHPLDAYAYAGCRCAHCNAGRDSSGWPFAIKESIGLLDEASWLGESDAEWHVPNNRQAHAYIEAMRTVDDLRRLLALAQDAERLRAALVVAERYRDRAEARVTALEEAAGPVVQALTSSGGLAIETTSHLTALVALRAALAEQAPTGAISGTWYEEQAFRAALHMASGRCRDNRFEHCYDSYHVPAIVFLEWWPYVALEGTNR
jgi:hypothetical protein